MKTKILELIGEFAKALDHCEMTSDLSPSDRVTLQAFALDLGHASKRITALGNIDDPEKEALIFEMSKATSMIREGQICSIEVVSEAVERVIRSLDSVITGEKPIEIEIMGVKPIDPWPKK
jgi:hypothetical protein